MNLRYISSNDWQALFTKYPFVEDYLTTCELRGELMALRTERSKFSKDTFSGRVEWVKNRIAELETIEDSLLCKMEVSLK